MSCKRDRKCVLQIEEEKIVQCMKQICILDFFYVVLTLALLELEDIQYVHECMCTLLSTWTGWGYPAASGTASSHFLCLTELSECIDSPLLYFRSARHSLFHQRMEGWDLGGAFIHKDRQNHTKETYGRLVNIQNLTVLVRATGHSLSPCEPSLVPVTLMHLSDGWQRRTWCKSVISYFTKQTYKEKYCSCLMFSL